MSKYISCFLMGGLGNQLFQIFTTIAYGIRTNRRVVFPYSDILTMGMDRNTYWESLLNSIKLFTTFNKKHGITNDALFELPQFKEKCHNYEIIPDIDINNFMLFGYYQSYKYFDNEKETIFSLIKLKEQKISILQKYGYLFDSPNGINNVSMHFRLGDYKSKQEYHPIMPIEYYEHALLNISLKRDNITVLYFCEAEDNTIVNSMVYSLKNLFNNVQFIKVDDNIPDWEQVLIMSCCSDNIIANSSFSWWGGYFNQNVGKFVCYPTLWFGPKAQHDVSDMFPINWTKISW